MKTYIKDGKRYSESRLARSGVTDPASQGFSVLVTQPTPHYDANTQLLKDAGTVLQDGNWHIDWQIEQMPEEAVAERLQTAKSDLIKRLHDACNTDLASLAEDYPERESQTWPFQLEEARAHLLDATAPTPFISSAIKQGESVAEYAALIVANNTAWATYAGSVVLKRRSYEQAINAAESFEQLRTIAGEIK